MKYLLVIGDGMADNPVPELGGKTPLEVANIPAIDALAQKGIEGSVVNCPKPLPAGSETAILSIFGCDPLRYFTGRSPMEAAALGLTLHEGDVCYRCNLVSFEEGDAPLQERHILSHSAGSITGGEALEAINALNADPDFAALLKDYNMELPPIATFRPLLIEHHGNFSSVTMVPPHDHLGEIVGPLLPSGSEKAHKYTEIMFLANHVLEHHPVTEDRRARGRMGANGVWIWAEGTALTLPSFREQYGLDGAVVSAVPICHGIGVLRGLEKVEVEGATGENDTNFEGKLEATWKKLNEYDFVCLHLEAPDECTHNGDLPGKIQSIEWLSSRLVGPLVERMEKSDMDYRILLLSDHKTLTSNRGHDGDPVPFLLYDSRVDTGRGGAYTEAEGEKGPFLEHGYDLLWRLFNSAPFTAEIL